MTHGGVFIEQPLHATPGLVKSAAYIVWMCLLAVLEGLENSVNSLVWLIFAEATYFHLYERGQERDHTGHMYLKVTDHFYKKVCLNTYLADFTQGGE